MMKRPRALEERGAGLADGLKTVAPDTGSLPRGGTPGEAQSERVKRGSRHDDQGVASSTRRSGDSHSTRSAKTTARLRPARSWRHGDQPGRPRGPWAGRPMPSLRLSHNQQDTRQILEFRDEQGGSMKLNNLSARLIVNAWLAKTGREPLSSDLSYEDFATALRRINATTNVQVPFASRADAVAYIRDVAAQHQKEVCA